MLACDVNATDEYLKPGEISTGTSLVAVEYDGGVIIGADSRTTSGPYVSNRVTDKLTQISKYIYCCRSGSAADTQAVADIVKYQLDFHKMEIGEEPMVKTAAHLFKTMLYSYREQLSAGVICAGWDAKNGGQVYSIASGGLMLRQPIAAAGSGSTYVYGFMDSQFRPGFNKEECFDFVAKTLSLCISRDGSSGGVIRLASISRAGVERRMLRDSQIPVLYHSADKA